MEKPYRTLLVSRRSGRDGSRDRSPDSRISLLANAFPAVFPPVAMSVGVRPRLQWRVREGVAPSSQQAPSRATTAIVNPLLSRCAVDVKSVHVPGHGYGHRAGRHADHPVSRLQRGTDVCCPLVANSKCKRAQFSINFDQ